MPSDPVTLLIERIEAGNQTDDDLRQLCQLLCQFLRENGSGQTAQLGKYNINLGQGQDLHVGDRYIGVTIEQIRLIIQELNTLKSPNQCNGDITSHNIDELPFPKLSLDSTTVESINLRLEVIQEIYEAGYLTESHKQELRQLKRNLQSFSSLNQDLQRITEAANRLLQTVVQHMHEQLDDLKRSGQAVTEQLQQDFKLLSGINCQQAEVEILQTFVNRLKDSRLGADWIERNKESLLKYAIKKTLQQFPHLNNEKSIVEDFKFSLKQFIDQINFCLYFGSYNILDNPEIPLVFDIEPYEVAFQSMKEFIPQRLGSDITQEIQACLDYLISRLSTYG